MQELDHVVAFATSPENPPVEVRVNFGMFAGREATPAEIDDLARVLIPEVGDVTIVREERHEISEDTEGSVQQVRIELTDAQTAHADDIVALAERWANACIAERHTEIADL